MSLDLGRSGIFMGLIALLAWVFPATLLAQQTHAPSEGVYVRKLDGKHMAGARVEPSQPRAGKRVRLVIGVFRAADGRVADQQQIEFFVTRPGDDEPYLRRRLEAERPGRFQTFYRPRTAGRYTFAVSLARRGDAQAHATFNVDVSE